MTAQPPPMAPLILMVGSSQMLTLTLGFGGQTVGIRLLLSPIPRRHSVVVRLAGEPRILAAFVSFGVVGTPQWHDVVLPPALTSGPQLVLELSLISRTGTSDGRVTLLDWRMVGAIGR